MQSLTNQSMRISIIPREIILARINTDILGAKRLIIPDGMLYVVLLVEHCISIAEVMGLNPVQA